MFTTHLWSAAGNGCRRHHLLDSNARRVFLRFFDRRLDRRLCLCLCHHLLHFCLCHRPRRRCDRQICARLFRQIENRLGVLQDPMLWLPLNF